MMTDQQQQQQAVHEDSQYAYENERPAFGSEINMGGGGGVIIQENIDNRSLAQRAHANAKLCGMGMLAGAGMFSEAYFLFAIGNVKNIWKQLYPECYDGDASCSENLVSSLTYIEVIGVIIGMLTFGYFADTFGRRIGSCSTAIIMCVGGILTAASDASYLTGQWIFFAVALFFFSYGVGGEYPLASASAAERAEEAKKRHSYAHHIRGKSVVLTFAMQGVGNFVNTLIIIFILLGQGCDGASEDCSDRSLELTWRLQYAIGALFLVALAIGRVIFLKESKVWQTNRTKSDEIASSAKSGNHRSLMFKHYWHRLVGTAVGWFVWDIVFYGNKLFQGTIIKVIIGSDATIYQTLEYTLLNSGVALVGYYVAAFTIDKPWMGRRRLQTIGFFWIFALFLICGCAYEDLSKPENISWFQALYYLSSFFGQFGPNSTTWLLPSELFPTDVRSQAHGISAASGKLGALFSSLLFTYGSGGEALDAKIIFIVCAVCGIVGLVVTELFVPDVTSMDLSHADERWELILEDRENEYSGDAVNAEYLSRFERMIGIKPALKSASKAREDVSKASSIEKNPALA
ncbi:Inorganic phosphate transporter 1-1 [Hondaea fermentalgiana]|uniref:Inorganic phosphate transporter 1-1 n=1 Tax=Hondaea fermentalgiana TaxID=2315210 RepID=A0A2R5GRT5_9STRA|nr:Inorganic phosphate transporter 1-1 [Hondaea fermentalgiana]|eukprot:GBG31353.1 Inorganic phosphate transporter 1-1 [Hondaea fermentalgiana]